MSGICGIVTPGDRYRPKTTLLERMCRALAPRGPDEGGLHVAGPVGLGVRPFAAADPDGPRQPLRDEYGNFCIVLDGRIDNSRELRRTLEAKGHEFRSKTDVEAALHAYEEFGEGFLDRIQGAFAVAVWDKQEEKLLLARDRMGVRPLYYTLPRREIVFASEIKALLQIPGIERSVDLDALDHFLTFGYVGGERTTFRKVRKLLPGHVLTFKNNSLSVRAYWKLPCRKLTGLPHQPPGKRQEKQLSLRLCQLVRESVKRQLGSDAQPSVLLSGGVHSASIVAFAEKSGDRRIKTISVHLEGTPSREMARARRIAERFDTDHSEYVIEPKVAELVQGWVRVMDQPLASPSVLPAFLLARVARECAAVALSGAAAAEVFGTSSIYRADWLAGCYDPLPRILRENAIPKLVQGIAGRSNRRSLLNAAKRLIEAATLPCDMEHLRWRVLLNDEEKPHLYSDDMKAALLSETPDEIRLLREFQGCENRVAGQMHVDFKTYLPENVLAIVDATSRANSLEVRLPFVDRELVEFVAGIPPRCRFQGLNTASIMKRATKPFLPGAVFRDKNQSFDDTLGKWLRRQLKPLLLDILSERTVRERGLFNWRCVNTLIGEHVSCRRDHTRRLWALLLLEQWLQSHPRPRSGASSA